VRRRLLSFLALLGGALAGFALLRRAGTRHHDRIDLYYDDGSLVSLNEIEGARLLELAKEALQAARA
jgi:hypothetical protein